MPAFVCAETAGFGCPEQLEAVVKGYQIVMLSVNNENGCFAGPDEGQVVEGIADQGARQEEPVGKGPHTRKG